ncbi:MAG: hypothetical protein K5922_04740 [Clostridiales bacterium]|nr:hypothetical protein [Clostridiales bacterium]
MKKSPPRESHSGAFRRYLTLLFLIPLGYLFHVCVMPYVSVGGVTPNLLFAVIGVITVAYGRLQALWAGLIYGLLLEILVPSVPFVSLAVYPISSLFVSFIFADKSLRQLQMDRTLNRKKRYMSAWLRTVLCAMSNVLVFEVVNVAYIYLGGTPLTLLHFRRALRDVLLTGILTFLIEFPLRRIILGRRTEIPVLKNQPIVFSKK